MIVPSEAHPLSASDLYQVRRGVAFSHHPICVDPLPPPTWATPSPVLVPCLLFTLPITHTPPSLPHHTHTSLTLPHHTHLPHTTPITHTPPSHYPITHTPPSHYPITHTPPSHYPHHTHTSLTLPHHTHTSLTLPHHPHTSLTLHITHTPPSHYPITHTPPSHYPITHTPPSHYPITHTPPSHYPIAHTPPSHYLITHTPLSINKGLGHIRPSWRCGQHCHRMQGSPEQVSGRASRRQCDVVSGCVLTQALVVYHSIMQGCAMVCKSAQ